MRLPPYPPELKIIENTAFSEYSKLAPRNLRMTLAHHPKLANAFQNLAHVVLFQTEVGARDREIAIIRTSALSRSEYVWGMHVEIYSESCGLTEEEIRDLTLKSSWRDLTAGVWTESEQVIVRFADELHQHSTAADETWAALEKFWSHEQVLELFFAASFYRLSSSFLNLAEVPLEVGARRFPPGITQARLAE